MSPDGFEPPTTGFEDQYSILLSYGPGIIKDTALRLKGFNIVVPFPECVQPRATGHASVVANGYIILRDTKGSLAVGPPAIAVFSHL